MKKTILLTILLSFTTLTCVNAQQGEIIYVDSPSPRLIGPSLGYSNALYDMDGNETNDIWVSIISYPWYYVQAYTMDSWQYYQHSVSHLDCFVSLGDTLNQIPDRYWLNPPETKDDDISKGGRVIYIDGWESVDSVLIAVRKPDREDYCYGWFRLSVIGDPDNLPENNQLKVIIHDYAFCTDPNYPFRAGQTSFDWEEIKETESIDFASIHPNPTNGIVTITGENLRQAEVANMLGQQMLSVNGNGNELHIDLTALPAGVYFVNVTDEEGRKCVHKVLKE